MWHQGPCDCGLHDALVRLSQEELTTLEAENPELVASFRSSLPKADR